jgi:hypothetical protein
MRVLVACETITHADVRAALATPQRNPDRLHPRLRSLAKISENEFRATVAPLRSPRLGEIRLRPSGS